MKLPNFYFEKILLTSSAITITVQMWAYPGSPIRTGSAPAFRTAVQFL